MTDLAPAVGIIKESFPSTIAIYCFGSEAQGLQSADSDLDIALLLPEKADVLLLWQCAQKIAATINKDVDLIDLREANTVLLGQIIGYGKRIFSAQSKVADSFENVALSQYIDFNEQRLELLKDIAKRGTVFK